ncbi:MAG: hypothetical protein JWN25_1365, partial [Verrucomicrobiales bacterium]|nr:hypothetical protein [Verrucomicrobiales bacterium]
MADAAKGLTVRLSASVSFYDPAWNILFIEDGMAGAYVWIPAKKPDLKVGQGILITGFTEKSGFHPVITRPTFSADPGAPGLKLQNVAIKDLMDGSRDCRWVEVEGRFVKATEQGDHLQIELDGNGTALQMFIPSASLKDVARLEGSRIKVQGVAATSMSNGVVSKVTLMIPSLANLEIDRFWTDEIFRLVPEDFSSSSLTTNKQGLMRVRGVITKVNGPRSFQLKINSSKIINIESLQESELNEGWILDVVGNYVAGGSPKIADAFYLRTGFADPEQYGKSGNGEVLPSVTAIRSLKSDQARLKKRVALSGVVTYIDPKWGNIFFQGASGGIYVDGSKGPCDVQVGDSVVLNGSTGNGDFGPIIRDPEFRILRRGQLPATRLLYFEQLFTGRYDCDWVETAGVVRSASMNDGHLVLELWTGGSSATVIVPDWNESHDQEKFVDSRIQFRGVAGSKLDEKNHFRGLQFFVPGAEMLKIIEPPTPSENLPVTPINTLFGFSPEMEIGHRIKTRGVVSLRSGKGKSLFIQDGNNAIYVEGANFNAEPGDVVEIVGFPRLGPIVPVMQDPKVVRVGHTNSPMPVRIFDPQEILQKKLDAQLVELDARLLDIIKSSGQKVIILQSGLDVFDAHLDLDDSNFISKLKPGSLIRLRGVASIQVDEWNKPRFFRILVGSSRDVELLSSPPFWTLRHLLVLTGGILFVAGLVLIYAVLLKRRVNEQTSRIREELEKSAVLKER